MLQDVSSTGMITLKLIDYIYYGTAPHCIYTKPLYTKVWHSKAEPFGFEH